MRGVALALALWSSAAWCADATLENLVGAVAPEFAFPDLHDRVVHSTAWNGHVVVINFWATWCVPCRTEIPMLNQLAKTYGARGVRFVGVAVDTKGAVEKFLRGVPIGYTVLVGGAESAKLVKRFGDRGGVLPYTVITGRDGRIASLAAGALTENYLRKTLDAITGAGAN